jgi:glycerol-3-phosphate acyltransferase PlsY
MILGLLCLAYLTGAIPTGLLAGRLFKKVDVRRHGSGNVGATNVFRVVGKLPGALVLAVDVLKGWLPVVLFTRWALGWGLAADAGNLPLYFGILAVCGHIWNPFLGFKGGRGVATSLGLLFALDPRVAGLSLAVWIAVAAATRYVSVASIAAAFSAPFWMTLLGFPLLWVAGGAGVAFAIILRHRPNIVRLLQGEEHKIGR